MPAKRVLTTDEILATLNHSSLPTLVVEGDEDVIIFRRLENSTPDLSLSVLPVGGRSQVFALFERRGEIRGKQEIAFVADQDLWVLSNVPQEYISDKLIFTDGYSIENDAFRDGNYRDLLYGAERTRFAADLENFSRWFALAAARNIKDGDPIDIHANHILDNEGQRETMMVLKEGETYPQELYEKIRTDYLRFVRGKSLFQLFQRQMRGSRPVKHSKVSLLEMAAARPGQHIQSLFERATAALTP